MRRRAGWRRAGGLRVGPSAFAYGRVVSDPVASIRSEGERSIAADRVIGSVLSTGADAINLVVNVDREGAGHLVPALEAALERSRAGSSPPLARVVPDYRGQARPDHVDREDEARALLTPDAVTVLSGPQGIGKTYVGWHALAHYAPRLPDGTVRLRAAAADLDDLEYALYSMFWSGGPPGRPPQPVIERDLAPLRAVIVLDDFPVGAEDMATELSAALAGCCLAFGTRAPIMPGAARQIELRGLADADALQLLERALGRSLTDADRRDGARLCAALHGHPGAIVEAAAEARAGGLAEVAAEVAGPEAFARLAARRAARLTLAQQAVLPMMAAFPDTPLGERHVAAITGRADAAAVLRDAQRQAFAAAHSPRYTLTGSLAAQPPADWDLAAARNRILEHYVAWVQSAPTIAELSDEHEALDRTMRHALTHGRQREAIVLGRALSDALLWSRSLGAWGAAITAVHRAAEAVGDTSALAWALHQAGVRAWWLNGGQAGVAELEEALRLRRNVLGDRAAAERTQRTLEAIRPPSPPPWWRRWHGLGLAAALLVVLAAVTVGAAALLGGNEATRVLTVSVRGEGVVVARYDDGERRCRTECHITVADEAEIALSPASQGFQEWSGDCDGTGTCTLAMDRDREATAVFAATGTPTPSPTATETPTATPTETPSPTTAGTHTVTVRLRGDATGTVTSDPEGIACGRACEHAFDDGTTVTFAADAAEGSRFTGWGNPDCADDQNSCRLELTADVRLAPTFEREPVPRLAVTLTQEKGYYSSGARSSVQVTVDGETDTCTVAATAEQLSAADVTNTCSYEAPEGASLAVTKPSTEAYSATCNRAQTRLPCSFDMPAGGASVELVFSAPPG